MLHRDCRSMILHLHVFHMRFPFSLFLASSYACQLTVIHLLRRPLCARQLPGVPDQGELPGAQERADRQPDHLHRHLPGRAHVAHLHQGMLQILLLNPSTNRALLCSSNRHCTHAGALLQAILMQRMCQAASGRPQLDLGANSLADAAASAGARSWIACGAGDPDGPRGLAGPAAGQGARGRAGQAGRAGRARHLALRRALPALRARHPRGRLRGAAIQTGTTTLMQHSLLLDALFAMCVAAMLHGQPHAELLFT